MHEDGGCGEERNIVIEGTGNYGWKKEHARDYSQCTMYVDTHPCSVDAYSILLIPQLTQLKGGVL